MKITTMMLCGTMAAGLPLAAVAQTNPGDRGSYIELQLGRSNLYNHDVEVPGGRITAESSTGDVVLLNSGYEFGQWALGSIRVEGELGYRNNGIDSFYGHPAGTTADVRLANPYGHTQMWSLMFNAINDFAPGTAFDPYIGVGVGYARIDFHHYGAAPLGLNSPGATFIDNVDNSWAYPGMIGFRSRLSPQFTLDVNWRYFKADSPSFTNSAGERIASGYQSQALMVGLAYTF
ncbi:MAG TPA: outer membrane beta-barrel protein [Gammaproteobacteria bacterium]|nr:outer membrane beta-barrel protein [Gammaproteobacteria bacterium]